MDVGQIDSEQGRGTMDNIGEFLATLGARDRVGLVTFPTGQPRVNLTTKRAAIHDGLKSVVGQSQLRPT